MSYHYTWDDLGLDTNLLPGQITKAIRHAACDLWIDNSDKFVPDNPVFAPARWFWNTVCDRRSQPPPPPFSGGQCLVDYTVTIHYDVNSNVYANDCGAQNYDRVLDGGFRGPIKGVIYEQTHFYPEDESIKPGCATPGSYGEWYLHYGEGQKYKLFTQYQSAVRTLQVINVVRRDGLPDNCGSIPTRYPRSPDLPPGGRNWKFPVTDEDGNSYDFDFNYKGSDFNFPLHFEFNFGDAYVDFGGITLNWNGDLNVNLPGGSPGNGGKNPMPPSPDNSPPPELYLPQPNDPDVDEKPPVEVPDGEGHEDEDDGDNKITWVEILMTIPPSERHRILYRDSSLNVYYYGWMSFTLNGTLSSAPEFPLRKSRHLVRIPDEYTGYKIGIINGAAAQIKSYTRKIVKKRGK